MTSSAGGHQCFVREHEGKYSVQGMLTVLVQPEASHSCAVSRCSATGHDVISMTVLVCVSIYTINAEAVEVGEDDSEDCSNSAAVPVYTAETVVCGEPRVEGCRRTTHMCTTRFRWCCLSQDQACPTCLSLYWTSRVCQLLKQLSTRIAIEGTA